MRVVVVTRIYRPEPSAASFFLGAVVDSLTEAGHSVEVLTARPVAARKEATPRERVRTWPVLRDRNGYVRGYLPYLSFDLPVALRLLFTSRADVVLVEPPPTTGAVVRVVCAARGIPYVYDAADIWSDAANMATGSGLVVQMLRGVERFALRGATHIVTISQGVVDRLRALGVAVPVTVSGFGADTDYFRPVDAEPAPLFVYAGSYSAWHGADVLIPAFSDFSRTHPGYRLLFIGNGTERAELERLVRDEGLAESVSFVDPVAPADLAPLLAGAVASLATLKPATDYTYAFASKTYSSLAVGCPVIFAGPGPTAAFIHAANEHLSAGAAVMHEPGAIADAMRALADDPPSSSDRVAVAEWTAREHSITAVGRRVARIVEAVAGRRGRR